MPKFPFKRDPAEHFRRLYQIDRIDRQARTLGRSSISRGEGAIRLRDGATVAAIYGDGPGGEFGFLVPDGSGGWRTVQEDAQARADAALSIAEGQIGALDTRMGAAEGRLDSHASRIGGVENRATTAEGRLDSHASRIGAAEGRLDNHAARIGAVEGAAANANAGVSGIYLWLVNTLVPAFNALVARVNALDGGGGGGEDPPVDPR